MVRNKFFNSKLMIMKKVTVGILMAFMISAFIPTRLKAGTETNVTPISTPVTTESAEVNAMIARLYEIKAMDLNDLKSTERKALRKEVRTIKSDLKAVGGGVYLSVSAIIIILLILLLLL